MIKYILNSDYSKKYIKEAFKSAWQKSIGGDCGLDTAGEAQCAELWRQYEPYLRRFCWLHLQSHPDEIDNVISEIFLALCRKLSSDEPLIHPQAWLYKTADHVIQAKYRAIYKEREKAIRFSDREYSLPYAQNFAEEVENELFVEELQQKLDKELSPQEKELLRYIYEDQLKMKEIAGILHTTESAVKQKHYRLCHKIRGIAKKLIGSFYG